VLKCAFARTVRDPACKDLRQPQSFPHLWKTLWKSKRSFSHKSFYISYLQAMYSTTIWDQVLTRIEDQVGKHSFSTWFKPTTLLADGGRSLSISVPNLLFVEWLPKHYSVVLAEALRDVGRPDVQLVFVPDTPASRRKPCATARRQSDPALHLRHLHRRAVESVRSRGMPRCRGNAVAFI
jgi:hypothetical protein